VQFHYKPLASEGGKTGNFSPETDKKRVECGQFLNVVNGLNVVNVANVVNVICTRVG